MRTMEWEKGVNIYKHVSFVCDTRNQSTNIILLTNVNELIKYVDVYVYVEDHISGRIFNYQFSNRCFLVWCTCSVCKMVANRFFFYWFNHVLAQISFLNEMKKTTYVTHTDNVRHILIEPVHCQTISYTEHLLQYITYTYIDFDRYVQSYMCCLRKNCGKFNKNIDFCFKHEHFMPLFKLKLKF